MSRAETRRRRILRDDGTGLVQKTCTNRFGRRARFHIRRAAIRRRSRVNPSLPAPAIVPPSARYGAASASTLIRI